MDLYEDASGRDVQLVPSSPHAPDTARPMILSSAQRAELIAGPDDDQREAGDNVVLGYD